MRGLALAMLFLLVTACAMGPDYTRPDVSRPEAFRMAEKMEDLASIANLPWWELLRDLELQKLIGIALQENKDLKRADRKSTRLNSSHIQKSRMPSSA